MNTFTVSFDYEGKPPTKEYITALLDGLTAQSVSIVIWTVVTKMDQDQLQHYLDTVIKNAKKYKGGKVTSATVEAG